MKNRSSEKEDMPREKANDSQGTVSIYTRNYSKKFLLLHELRTFLWTTEFWLSKENF